jgi:hypothetical protein
MVVRKDGKGKRGDVEKSCKALIEKKKGTKESQIEEGRPIWYQFETWSGGRKFWLRAQRVH